ncbi:MAG: hypothetical protein PWP67_2389, partial [Clostridium butyricum]|nr:hypothetical protein [Clostridium butyricum]
MGKTIIINLEKVNISGDVLDVGEKNLGIIYNLTKEAHGGAEENIEARWYDEAW